MLKIENRGSMEPEVKNWKMYAFSFTSRPKLEWANFQKNLFFLFHTDFDALKK